MNRRKMHGAVDTPEPEEIESLREERAKLDDSTARIVDLRRRLRKIKREVGMEVLDTGAFPTAERPSHPSPGE